MSSISPMMAANQADEMQRLWKCLVLCSSMSKGRLEAPQGVLRKEMKSCDFLFGESILARGGFLGSVIEMKKGPDDVSVPVEEAMALNKLGKYRLALAKFRPALATLQTNGDNADAVDVHLMMIRCHDALEEVSSRS